MNCSGEGATHFNGCDCHEAEFERVKARLEKAEAVIEAVRLVTVSTSNEFRKRWANKLRKAIEEYDKENK